MKLFAPALAFVDLETTGTRAADDRVTEIGIVRVDCAPDGGPPRVSEWSSLVGRPRPGGLQVDEREGGREELHAGQAGIWRS